MFISDRDYTIEWSSQIKVVKNTKTGKRRYYFLICDVYQRVTQENYFSRLDDSTRTDSFRTVIKGDLVHHYKTVYGSC